MNASATFELVFVVKDGVYNPLHANITGWGGLIIPALLLVGVVMTGKFAPAAATSARVVSGVPPRDEIVGPHVTVMFRPRASAEMRGRQKIPVNF